MKLTNIKPKDTAKGSKLAGYKSKQFKIAFGTELENKYSFKTRKARNLAEGMHKFLECTIYKELTITEVDELYLRTKGEVKEKTKYDKNNKHNNQIEIQHYGFKRDAFRLFGFYDNNAYFNITKIDTDHKTHKG